MITAKGLLSSWATPASSEPRAGELLLLVQRLALARDLLLGPAPLGRVAADGLVARQPAVGVEQRPVEPLVPAHLAVREDLLVLAAHDRVLGRKRFQLGAQQRADVLRDAGVLQHVLAQEFLRPLAEDACVGGVREGEPEVGAVTADQLGLVLDNGPEALLAGLEQSLSPLLGRDVDVEAADMGDDARSVLDGEADHHAPLISVEPGQVLLVPGRPAGLDHLTVVGPDHRHFLRPEGCRRLLAQHLAGRPAQDLLHLRVEHDVAAAEDP